MAGTIYVSLRSLHPQQGAQWRGGLVESSDTFQMKEQFELLE